MNTRDRQPPNLDGLSAWAPELAQALVMLSSDIALVLDANGIIKSVAQGGVDHVTPRTQEWIGSAWVDTATSETRGKVEQMLKEVNSTGRSRRREINHPGAMGATIPIEYTAMRLGESGPVLAVGRDLRAVAAIQQRFLESQQDVEKAYWRARQADSQYRLLFEVATDAVLVVDETLQIVEANQAASQLFELAIEQLIGRPVTLGFERQSHGALEELFMVARRTAQPSELRARVIGRLTATSVAATPFRSERGMRLLVRVRTVHTPASSAELSSALGRLVGKTTDGIVVTDSSGRILVANPAFVELLRLDAGTDLRGRFLMEWIAAPPVLFETLLSQVRREGIARSAESRLRSRNGEVVTAEISAALLTEGDQECIGFTIHCVARRAVVSGERLKIDMEDLASRLGSDALPSLLRDGKELIESFLIENAVERSGGNLSKAAELLGTSIDRLTRWQRRVLGLIE